MEEARIKKLAASGNVAAALRLAKSVYEANPCEKLKKKIKKMEEHLEMFGEDSNDDEDEMVCLGDDFYLYAKVHKRLYSYQIDGILFLWKLFKMKKGGVIADDMGLGKTIQIIAFLSGMFDMDQIKNALIVLPVSLIPNWENEFENWAPGIKVLQYYGSNSIRERNLNKIQRHGGVLLTTYGLVRNQGEKLNKLYGKTFKWDYLILDEAHAIKNPTKQTKCLHQIDSSNRIVLTGTPVQNNLRELWSLYDFVHSGTLLGTVTTFKTEYETPIVRSREKDATSGQRLMGEKISENLLKKIAPFFLRRTKAQVLKDDTGNDATSTACKPKELGQKNDFIIWLYLTPLQERLYLDFLRTDDVKEILMTKKSPLVQLTIMKKICDHPRLLARHACESLGFDNLADCDDLEECARSIVDKNLNHLSTATLLAESNKISFTLKLVTELKATGHRCLIFSLSKKLLSILQKVLLENNFILLRLDGDVTDVNDRARIVEKFQNRDKYDVLLLTTKVGGVGLTLTAADRVIILDPSWNPAVDSQAVDRVFRIGQDKPVVVYRLITCSTIEEKIYRRQIFKESIIRQANKDCQDPFRYFTKEELRSLFKLENVRYSNTQKQLEEMHKGQRLTNEQLEEHIAFLYSLDIFGISDHDLMFTRAEEVATMVDDPYVDAAVARAEQKMQTESDYVNKLKEGNEYKHYSDYTHKLWQSGKTIFGGTSSKDASTKVNNDEIMLDDEPEFPPITEAHPAFTFGFEKKSVQTSPTNFFANANGQTNTFRNGNRKTFDDDVIILASDSEEENEKIDPMSTSDELVIADSLEDIFAASTSNKGSSQKRRSCASILHKLHSLTQSPPTSEGGFLHNEEILDEDNVQDISDDDLPQML